MNEYFALLDKIRDSMRRHQYQDTLQLSYKSLPLVPGLISDFKREFGTFDIISIPCIELAARFSSAQGDVTGLEALKTWVGGFPELEPWLKIIDERLAAARVQSALLDLLAQTPGYHQNDLPGALGMPGRLTAKLAADMEHLGLITRDLAGKTYALYRV